jgi:hypothetical protein
MTRSDIADRALYRMARRAEQLRMAAVVAAMALTPLAVVILVAVVARAW